MVPCILCQNPTTKALGEIQEVAYYHCDNCQSIFKSSSHFPGTDKERGHYLLHENDVNDPSYQKFVNPIIQGVLENFDLDKTGLDFGAGTAPVITDLLVKKGYFINKYDPFFHPDTTVLSGKYDFIACCEVIEHFHNPSKEFDLLYRLLKPKGMLFCMTELLPDLLHFSEWYYKKDPTHVIFYSENTLGWIKDHFGFASVEISGRLSIFTK